MAKELEGQWLKPNPALKGLEVLIGEWNMEGNHPLFPSPVRGHASFEWVEEGAFIVWHSEFEHPGLPNGIAIIGRDDPADNCCMLYFDGRGVSRVYLMSLEGRIWKYWRSSPGFSQRMTGMISDDLNTIAVHGEKSSDGINWEQDLDLTFTKVR